MNEETWSDQAIYQVILEPFLGKDIQLNKNYISPIPRKDGRKDSNPSFRLYAKERKDGTLAIYWKDYGRDDIEGFRHIDLAVILWGCDKKEAWRRIFSKNPKIEAAWTASLDGGRSRADFGAKIDSNLRDYELAYWEPYNITAKTLKRYGVCGLRALFINKEVAMTSTKKEPAFVYMLDSAEKAWQVYRPDPKRFYLVNMGSQLLGERQLPWTGEELFVVSGMKDGLVLAETGRVFVAGSGENKSHPLFDNLEYLKKRFRNVYVVFDNDSAGRKAQASFAEKYKVTELKLAWPVDSGDLADVSRDYGLDAVEFLIEEAKLGV